MKCEEKEEETRVLSFEKGCKHKAKGDGCRHLAGEHCVAMEEMRGREEEGEEERRVQLEFKPRTHGNTMIWKV